MAERLIREQQALSALKGTAAVEVLDIYRGNDGELCLVMELLEGDESRRRICTRSKSGTNASSSSRVAEIFDPIVDTLEVAHKAGHFAPRFEAGERVLARRRRRAPARFRHGAPAKGGAAHRGRDGDGVAELHGARGLEGTIVGSSIIAPTSTRSESSCSACSPATCRSAASRCTRSFWAARKSDAAEPRREAARPSARRRRMGRARAGDRSRAALSERARVVERVLDHVRRRAAEPRQEASVVLGQGQGQGQRARRRSELIAVDRVASVQTRSCRSSARRWPAACAPEQDHPAPFGETPASSDERTIELVPKTIVGGEKTVEIGPKATEVGSKTLELSGQHLISVEDTLPDAARLENTLPDARLEDTLPDAARLENTLPDAARLEAVSQKKPASSKSGKRSKDRNAQKRQRKERNKKAKSSRGKRR